MTNKINIEKKENPIVKFINKYFGAKYSVIFAIGKQALKEKPTVTGTLAGLVFLYTVYFVSRYSKEIWYLVAAYVIAYTIKMIIKIVKLKRKNKLLKENKKEHGTNDNKRRIEL